MSIIEALAAVSMNPDNPPEDRAKQILEKSGLNRMVDDVKRDAGDETESD